MTVPVEAPKRRRRTQRLDKKVATPTIPVAQAAGALAPTAGPVPVPSLSTTTVAGGAKKKVALKIPLPYANSPNTPAPVSVKPKRTTPTQKETKVQIQPTKRKNFTMKRKFVAKKIMVGVDNSNKLRKTRDAITSRVDAMKLPEITAALRAKGLIREHANPPEAMQRSMMKDILNFPTPL
uniref:Uncharacterized protein n=1 Tax=viral metagenome TaxID=1070528 RepID=A0A6C0KZ62_9ZZZZ